jgi:hypothetical protein
MCEKFWSENLKERDHSEDLGVYGRIILDWISGKQCEKVSTGWRTLAITVMGKFFTR